MFCSNCGNECGAATVCMKCGVPVTGKKQGSSAAVRMLIPVGRSGWAIAAGYLAIFSILILPAPFALITGIVAIIDIKKHPDKHGMGRAIFGIIVGTIVSIFMLMVLLHAME